MRATALPTVILTAIGYLILNHVWLWAANSTGVSSEARPLLKGVALALAFLLYVGTTVLLSQGTDQQWAKRVALNAGAAVGAGAILIVISSALWRRGQFFHDATPLERVPSLLLIVVGAAFAAAVVAPAVAWIGRLVWRR